MIKTGSDECSMVLVSKVFLTRVLGKCVPLIRTAVQKRSTRGWDASARGEVSMWLKGLTLEGEIVKNPSVIISHTLARNEKVEHYIRIKTHKPITLRF